MKTIPVETIIDSIGEKLQACRKEAGLTLNQLAQKAGVSPAAIHKIEKKEMIPSITILMKLTRALNKGVSYFTQENNGFFQFQERVETVRRNHRKILTSSTGAKMEVLAMCLEGGQMEACMFTFRPGSKSSLRAEVHKGEEFFLVMEGELSIVLENDLHLLKEGDSIHFISDTPHRWENTGEEDLRFLWVMTPLPLSSLERWIP